MGNNPERTVGMKRIFENDMVPDPFVIQRNKKETHDTATFDLMPADGKGISRFKAGQFNMLYMYGIGEVPISITPH